MKKKKPWYKKSRGIWLINPKTRIKKSKKIYERNKEKLKFLKEIIKNDY